MFKAEDALKCPRYKGSADSEMVFTPLHLESDELPRQGLASMWQFCLGGVEELGDSVVLTDDLVPSLVSTLLSSELESKLANLVQGRYGVM